MASPGILGGELAATAHSHEPRVQGAGAPRPTVGLVVMTGFSARFLLRTEILPTLRSIGARIVIVTPNADEEYFREEFAGEDIAVEMLFTELGSVRRSSWRKFIFQLRKFALPQKGASAAFRGKYLRNYRARLRRQPVRTRVQHVLLHLLWRSRTARLAVLAVEKRVYRRALHDRVFERHGIDLLVTTSPGYQLGDAIIMCEAERRGIRCVTTVLGWDNPTSKGYRGADPHRVIAWSERMSEQLERYHDLPPDRVVVGGVPHFDRYQRPDELLTREELCAGLGLDPTKRIVAFATCPPGSYRANLEVATELARAALEGRFGEGAQIVVRLHPIAFRADHLGHLAGFEELAESCDHVALDLPGVRSLTLRCDMPGSDGAHLASLLKHAGVLVNIFSTTTLEAFLVDTPVVMVAYSGNPDWTLYEHLRPLVDSGGAQIADTLEELVEQVSESLEHPQARSETRRRIARQETGPLDGRSGERIGRIIAEEALDAVRARSAGQSPVQRKSQPTSGRTAP